MYLSAETYVGGWSHSSEAEKEQYAHLVEAAGLGGFRCECAPSGFAKVNVAYWRKANQIHKWFVDNVQKGSDDCGSYPVSREQLSALVDLCKKVLAGSQLVPGAVENGRTYTVEAGKPTVTSNLEAGKIVEDESVARSLLPTQEGFFFGNTDYDEYYVRDLEDTVRQLEPLLTERFKGFSFEYQSSW